MDRNWWDEEHYICTNGSPKTLSGMEPDMEGVASEFDVVTYIGPYILF